MPTGLVSYLKGTVTMWELDLIARLDGAIVRTFVALIFLNNLAALSGKYTVNGKGKS